MLPALASTTAHGLKPSADNLARNLVEVVEGGKAMFARWPDIDMRAANVPVLEQRKSVEYRGGGNAVESGKHPAIIQDTDIVERRLNSREHIANCGFGLVHQRHPSNVFHRGRGAPGRERPRPKGFG